MGRVILALDLALRTGWAWGGDQGVEGYGAIEIPGKSLGARTDYFDRELRKVIRVVKPGTIWVEKAHGNSSSAAGLIVRALLTLVVLQAYRQRPVCPVFDVAANTLKKATTGRGNAAKEPMRDVALRILREGGDLVEKSELGFDEADAVCLWAYGRKVGA